MMKPTNCIGTAYQRDKDGQAGGMLEIVATKGDGMELDLIFVMKGKQVFAATVECVPCLVEVGACVLAESDDTHLWVRVPNPKADSETLSMSGLHIRELRQQFADVRAEIDRLERDFGLLPLR